MGGTEAVSAAYRSPVLVLGAHLETSAFTPLCPVALVPGGRDHRAHVRAPFDHYGFTTEVDRGSLNSWNGFERTLEDRRTGDTRILVTTTLLSFPPQVGWVLYCSGF